MTNTSKECSQEPLCFFMSISHRFIALRFLPYGEPFAMYHARFGEYPSCLSL